MASYGYTFTSGDTVTPTKLNNARTVSNIVNADVSASAAIAGTKIAPDFGSQNVVTTGTLAAGIPSVLGATAARQAKHINGGTVNAAVSVVTSGQGFISVNSEGGSTSASAGSVALVRGRGTLGSPGVVSNGDWLGAITYQGHDGTAPIIAAKIQAEVDGTPGTNDMPGRLVFSTTAASASTPTERLRIDSSGNVGIANTSPSEKLHVTGNIKASGFIDADTSFRGQASDSASAPSFTWTSDTDTGIFRPGANIIAIATSGAEAVRVGPAGLVGINNNAPAYRLDVDGIINTSSSFRFGGTQVVGARITGWAAATGTATRTTFATSTVTTAQLAERVKALIDDLRAHGLIGN